MNPTPATGRTVPVRVIESPRDPESASSTIPLARLVTCPLHRRSAWGDLQGLAASIQAVGLIQPLVARPVGDVLEVVAGERRRRSAELAGLSEVQVVIRALTDEEVIWYQLAENAGSNRQNLHPMDEAELYGDLVQRGRAVQMIAETERVDVKHVQSRLKLCALVPELRAQYLAGLLSDFAAFALARIPSQEVQIGAASAIAREEKRGPRLSDAQITDLLRRHYVLPLAMAPWPMREEVGGQGSCSDCPKRTLAQRELFDDLYAPGGAAKKRDDFCTDAGCWTVKLDATWKAEVKIQEDAGGQVLQKRESAGIWAEWARVGELRQLAPGGAWLDRNEKPEGGGGKAWEQIMAEEPMVLVRDPDGMPRLVYDAKAGRAALRKLTKAKRAEVEPDAAPVPDPVKAERAEQRKARKVADEITAKLIAAALVNAPNLSTTALVCTLAGVAVAAAPLAAGRIAKRAGVDAEQLLMEARRVGYTALAPLLVEILLEEAADQVTELSPVVIKACQDMGVNLRQCGVDGEP